MKKLKGVEGTVMVFVMIVVICSVGVTAFLSLYFSAYQNSYMQREVFDLSEDWQYETPGSGIRNLDSLRTGVKLGEGETMTLYKALDIDLADAAILVRAKHQFVSVYVDGTPLLTNPYVREQNPGVAWNFISLPADYPGKTLKIEITSPYASYSGRTSPVFMGTMSSLRDYVRSEPLRPLMLMAVCLAVWLPIAVIGFLQGRGTQDPVHKELPAIGFYAFIWAIFYVCSEYDVLPFFTAVQRSIFVMSLYFALPVPLALFFYFSFERYKKWMLPAVAFHIVFSAGSLALQFLGLLDLPQIVDAGNIAVFGIVYTTVLAVMEAVNKNRIMMLTVPFLIIAYIFALYYYYIFYTRQDAAEHYYHDYYFLLILAILIYSIWHFFRDVCRQKRENEILAMQERLMRESYENFQTHLRETAGLKHDMKNHFAAIRAYLESGRIEEARDYLIRYAGQTAAVTEAAYSEHFLINAVVGSLYQRARENGVKVAAHVDAMPAHIADTDLYSVLTNLTDNALEACLAVPEEQERFICLTVTKRKPYLSIRCANSKAGEIISADGKIQTTKSGDGHGYGLWIIERIVNAYEGMINVEHDDTTFTVTLALKDK